jgi:DNA-binding response OmpR family regulator
MAGQRVMIVEDDSHFGGQLVDLFEFQGYHVDLLSDGERFMETFLQRRPSVVIIDLVLPITGGVALTRMLRAVPEGVSVPVFLMSAVYRDPRLFERELRELGVVEFLAKPFSPIDLGRKVDALLDSATELNASQAQVTDTGSWRLSELRAALGEGPVQLGLQAGFDRRSLLGTFVQLFRRHSAGCLSLTRGAAQRDIYFLNGYPVAAESGEDSESLVAVLDSLGLLDREAGDNAARVAQLEGVAVRDILLSRRLVKERKLKRAERARVKRIVIASFDWPSGSCEFEVGEDLLSGRSVAEVNPVACLSEVVARSLKLEELSPDLEPRLDQVVRKGARFAGLVSYVQVPQPLEGLLDCFEGEHTLGSLFKRYSAGRDGLTRVLWLMLSLGVIEGQGALRDSTPSGGDSAAPSGGRPGVRRGAAAFAFVDEHYRVRIRLDYYAFLGLERFASGDQIEAARARLAALYTPRSIKPATEEKLKALRTRLQVSFATLSDPTERSQYDHRLAALDTGEWTWPLSQE